MALRLNRSSQQPVPENENKGIDVVGTAGNNYDLEAIALGKNRSGTSQLNVQVSDKKNKTEGSILVKDSEGKILMNNADAAKYLFKNEPSTAAYTPAVTLRRPIVMWEEGTLDDGTEERADSLYEQIFSLQENIDKLIDDRLTSILINDITKENHYLKSETLSTNEIKKYLNEINIKHNQDILKIQDIFEIINTLKSENDLLKSRIEVLENCKICNSGVLLDGLYYNSLQDAINVAEDGQKITLTSDNDIPTALEITKNITIDLNNKNITISNDIEGNGVFWVKSGGKLTINGEGTINAICKDNFQMAIWADGGEVVINNGIFTNVGAKDYDDNGLETGFVADQYDLIYAKNNGKITINGGTFICETPTWTLNLNNSRPGIIDVRGGTFYDYDPSNSKTDDAKSNFVADGFMVTSSEVEGKTIYKVIKK